MRAVKKIFGRIPAGLKVNNLFQVIDLTDPYHKGNIDRKYYRNSSVIAKLKDIYKSKCAYCEAYEPEPEIEHYRPKKQVTDAKNHPGYYWLCYEWSNLLPVCHDCNKQGSKGNRFPIQGQRQLLPKMKNGNINLKENRLTSKSLSVLETPLILNPEFPGYDPFDYFKINAEGEFLPNALPPTLEYRKAINTIESLRLNRDKLQLIVRKREIHYLMERIKWILYKYLNGDYTKTQYEDSFLEILIEIKAKSRLTASSEYWFFWNYFLNNFNLFLSQYFIKRFRQGLSDTYSALIVRVV